jgi:hypothetical protein
MLTLYIMYLISTGISVKKHIFTSVLPMLLCDEAVALHQDSVSIENLNECQLFSSVFRLTVNIEVSDCSLVNRHIVWFFMWRCASASAARSGHKQYERSEVKIRMCINIFRCWRIRPPGM